MESVRVAIWGSCITRDFIEFDTEKKLTLCECISRSSLFSALASSAAELYQESDLISKWQSSCVKTDFNKNHFVRLKDAEAEYLILDLIDERFDLLEIDDREKKTYVTLSNELHDAKILDESLYRKINIDEYGGGVEQGVKKFTDNILKLFPSESIMINQGFLVSQYINKNGDVVSFSNKELIKIEKTNKRIKKLYELLIQGFDRKCRVIEMPEGICADASHKWSLKPYHYERKFYTEALKSVLKIIEE